jgi:hypothetical protein
MPFPRVLALGNKRIPVVNAPGKEVSAFFYTEYYSNFGHNHYSSTPTQYYVCKLALVRRHPVNNDLPWHLGPAEAPMVGLAKA